MIHVNVNTFGLPIDINSLRDTAINISSKTGQMISIGWNETTGKYNISTPNSDGSLNDHETTAVVVSVSPDYNYNNVEENMQNIANLTLASKVSILHEQLDELYSGHIFITGELSALEKACSISPSHKLKKEFNLCMSRHQELLSSVYENRRRASSIGRIPGGRK